mmetsp:Transcript_35389/g.59745  ORF Transcript_35389/g.59745 Transcript_35389/m.59745 type:complete len:129 (+) Transcript_35389:88-474(+)
MRPLPFGNICQPGLAGNFLICIIPYPIGSSCAFWFQIPTPKIMVCSKRFLVLDLVDHIFLVDEVACALNQAEELAEIRRPFRERLLSAHLSPPRQTDKQPTSQRVTREKANRSNHVRKTRVVLQHREE